MLHCNMRIFLSALWLWCENWNTFKHTSKANSLDLLWEWVKCHGMLKIPNVTRKSSLMSTVVGTANIKRNWGWKWCLTTSLITRTRCTHNNFSIWGKYDLFENFISNIYPNSKPFPTKLECYLFSSLQESVKRSETQL